MGVSSAQLMGGGKRYGNIEYLMYGQISDRLVSFFSMFINITNITRLRLGEEIKVK